MRGQHRDYDWEVVVVKDRATIMLPTSYLEILKADEAVDNLQRYKVLYDGPKSPCSVLDVALKILVFLSFQILHWTRMAIMSKSFICLSWTTFLAVRHCSLVRTKLVLGWESQLQPSHLPWPTPAEEPALNKHVRATLWEGRHIWQVV